MMQCRLVRYVPVFQKMQTTGPSETLVNVYKPTLRHVASWIFCYDLFTNCPSLTGAGHFYSCIQSLRHVVVYPLLVYVMQ